jgi:hypothetical protein
VTKRGRPCDSLPIFADPAPVMSTETCTDTAGDASVGLPDSSGAGAAIGVAANVLQPGIGQAMLTCTDETLDRAPHCPGVYRFLQ